MYGFSIKLKKWKIKLELAVVRLIRLSQGGMDYCGLNDGYPHCQIKLKKYKTSENEQSHGSFFLTVGELGKKRQ